MRSLSVGNSIYKDYWHCAPLNPQWLLPYEQIMLYCGLLELFLFVFAVKATLQNLLLCNPASLCDSTFRWMTWSARVPALHRFSILFSLFFMRLVAHREIPGLQLLSDISPALSADTFSFAAPIPKLFEYSTAAALLRHPGILYWNKHSLVASGPIRTRT